MNNFPDGFKAIVFGASGAIGSAFMTALNATPECAQVIALSRSSVGNPIGSASPRFDLEDESSMAAYADALKADGPYHLIIDATGVLQLEGMSPEKRLADLNAAQLMRLMIINAIGPALLLKHFIPLLPLRERCVFATLSARVGSITDNRKGGWYSYRASKAALNMLLQTAAIEACRKRPDAVFLALQPGTVRSTLSAPFASGSEVIEPATSVAQLLVVIDQAPAIRAAAFMDYAGKTIAW